MNINKKKNNSYLQQKVDQYCYFSCPFQIDIVLRYRHHCYCRYHFCYSVNFCVVFVRFPGRVVLPRYRLDCHLKVICDIVILYNLWQCNDLQSKHAIKKKESANEIQSQEFLTIIFIVFVQTKRQERHCNTDISGSFKNTNTSSEKKNGTHVRHK